MTYALLSAWLALKLSVVNPLLRLTHCALWARIRGDMNGSVSDMLVSQGKQVEGGVKLSVAEMPVSRESQGTGHPTTFSEKGEERAGPLAWQMPTKTQHWFPAGV